MKCGRFARKQAKCNHWLRGGGETREANQAASLDGSARLGRLIQPLSLGYSLPIGPPPASLRPSCSVGVHVQLVDAVSNGVLRKRQAWRGNCAANTPYLLGFSTYVQRQLLSTILTYDRDRVIDLLAPRLKAPTAGPDTAHNRSARHHQLRQGGETNDQVRRRGGRPSTDIDAAMYGLLATLLLAATGAVRGHMVITYPGWRGDNLLSNGTLPEFNTDAIGVTYEDGAPTFPYGMQWIYPCGSHERASLSTQRILH